MKAVVGPLVVASVVLAVMAAATPPVGAAGRYAERVELAPAGATIAIGTTATWRSPWQSSRRPFSRLVASWSARTPEGTSIVVAVRGRDRAGRTSSWDTLARWASGDTPLRRSAPSQRDDLARVDVDEWVARRPLAAWQLQVRLERHRPADPAPVLDAASAVVSDAVVGGPSVSARRRAVEWDVPQLSQGVHRGHFPRLGGGGRAWCSPTALTMVLSYHHLLPPGTPTWLEPGHRDGWVDDTAREVYDRRYRGTGNWSFNVAYAAARAGAGGTAYVDRLADLRRAERFLDAGLPLVASIAFSPHALTGAPIASTDGHLVVIAGFTASGDVIAADPAGRPGAIRRVYRRAQFERAWQRGGRGTVYVVVPPGRTAPSDTL